MQIVLSRFWLLVLSWKSPCKQIRSRFRIGIWIGVGIVVQAPIHSVLYTLNRTILHSLHDFQSFYEELEFGWQKYLGDFLQFQYFHCFIFSFLRWTFCVFEMVLGFCEVVVALTMLVLLLLDIYCVIKLGLLLHFLLQTGHVQRNLYGDSGCLSLSVLLRT